MLSIRSANQDDAAAIARVHVASWRSTYAGIVAEEYLAALDEAKRELSWREWLTRGIETYVAALDGEIVGFITGGAIREPIEPYDAELYAIYLLQAAHGQGIGRQLLRQLVVMLLGRGFHSMAVWVLEQNPATNFYERTGGQRLTSKEIEIGGATLVEVAYGWPDLTSFPAQINLQ
jgi:GNAT superfamily N-acetyltransferase